MRKISPKEALKLDVFQLLFLDFESEGPSVRNPSPPQVILGTMNSSEFVHRFVFDPQLYEILEANKFDKYIQSTSLLNIELISEALDMCYSEANTIVAWSEKEFHVLNSLPNFSAEKWSYVNLRKLAQQWWRQIYGRVTKPEKLSKYKPGSGHSLEYYEKITNYQRPTIARGGKVGTTLRLVHAGHKKRGLLTTGEKRKLTRLLMHNDHDLRAMAHILEFIKISYSKDTSNPIV